MISSNTFRRLQKEGRRKVQPPKDSKVQLALLMARRQWQ